MARRYRKKSNTSFLDEAAGIIGILIFAVGYTKYNEIQESNPELMPLIYAGSALIALLVAVFIIRSFIKNFRTKKTFSATDIDNMDGVKFEYYLADLLRARGYTDVKVTEKYDLGVDIIAKKDGITWGVQAKRYKSMVKVAAVRQAYSALSHYGCDRAMVVTNSHYSNPAKTIAQETNTVLIGRDQLMQWVYEVNQQG